MTLLDLVTRLKLGIARDDLAPSYTLFINEAQREICKLRSWEFMRKAASLTLLNGNSTVALPSDFKELSSSKTPIYAVGTDGSLVPSDVVTREQRIRRAVIYPLVITNTPQVFIDWTVSPPVLNAYAKATQDIGFNVSYFGFPDDLAADGDSNKLTIDFPEMLLARAKSIAFSTVNDPAMADAEEVFHLKFDEARRSDSYSALAGLRIRM